MSFPVDLAKRFLLGGAKEFAASMISVPSPNLHKREMMRFEKRKEICSTDAYFEYSCPDGSYCVGTRSCRRKANYAWTAVFGVVVLLALIYVCIRRSRARSAMASQQPVVTTTVVPGQEQQQYAQYAPPQNFAPPPGDPNMAYQTPHSYPPPAGAAYPPPGGSPYGEKPPGTYAPPMEAPPAAYSPYPQTSGAYSPAPAAYSAPPAGAYPPPATAYSGAPYTPPAGQPQAGYGAPAPYPVPQGEASSYAPPK